MMFIRFVDTHTTKKRPQFSYVCLRLDRYLYAVRFLKATKHLRFPLGYLLIHLEVNISYHIVSSFVRGIISDFDNETSGYTAACQSAKGSAIPMFQNKTLKFRSEWMRLEIVDVALMLMAGFLIHVLLPF
uniref:Uncharacterized protein n=1 Tax=Glossina brevipalpis TaxID=37001 RepID=A0A1A9W4Z4_9MUSC